MADRLNERIHLIYQFVAHRHRFNEQLWFKDESEYAARMEEFALASADPELMEFVKNMPVNVVMAGVEDPEVWRKAWRARREVNRMAKRKSGSYGRRARNKDVRRVVKEAEKEGAVVMSGGKHPILVKDGQRIAVSNSHKAMAKELRQRGILKEGESMARKPGGYQVSVEWSDRDLDRMKTVLRGLGYDRDKSKGKGRGSKTAGTPGALSEFVKHAVQVGMESNLKTWDSLNAGQKAVQYAWDNGRSSDWAYLLIMSAVADIEQAETAKETPAPVVEEKEREVAEEKIVVTEQGIGFEKIGPAYGDGKADPVFACEECGKEFATPNALGAHKMKAHGTPGASRTAQKRHQRQGGVYVGNTVTGESEFVKLREVNQVTSTQPVVQVSQTNGNQPLTEDSLSMRLLTKLVGSGLAAPEIASVITEVVNLELGLTPPK